MSPEFYWIAVVAVTVLSSARLTRLAVYDDLPPVAWLRAKYEVATEGSGWQLLAQCGFCFSFWVVLAVMGTGLWADVYDGPPPDGMNPGFVWWVVTSAFALTYLAGMTVARDGDGPNQHEVTLLAPASPEDEDDA